MPSHSRRQYVAVEVTPEGATSRPTKSNLAPASPTPGSPNKSVRFARETVVKAEARQLTQTEAWSLYHFECHARQCPECYNPLDDHHGRRLCSQGHGLAQDVAEHVYRQDGVVYSRKKDNHKLVQIEMPHDYGQTAQLLRRMERTLRTKHRTVPTISYDRTYPVAPRREASPPSDDDDDEPTTPERREVFTEPFSSSDRRYYGSPSKYPSARYQTVVLDNDVAAAAASSGMRPTLPSERRSARMYYDDAPLQRRGSYKVEIREPERKEKRRDKDRPRSGFWP